MSSLPQSARSQQADARPAPTAREWLSEANLIAAGITLIALALRLHDYTLAPGFLDNRDELQFTWAGMNLLLHGDAMTWEYTRGYPAYTTISAFGTTFPIVHHWMNHPPGFQLLMGGWVLLLGDRSMLDVTPAQVRILPVLFSTITVAQIYVLGRRLLGVEAALLAAALLATSPATVYLGRQAEPESLQAVLLLAALLLTLSLVENRGRRWTAVLLLLCCFLAPLLKVSGIAVGGICAVILAVNGRWGTAAAAFLGAAAGLAAFAAYGAVVDWQLFLRVWGVMAGMRSGVMNAFDFITMRRATDAHGLSDGWWILGFIGVGLAAAHSQRRTGLFVVWPVVAYLALMAIAAPTHPGVDTYGWYRVIVYPSVYLAAAWLTWEAIRRRSMGLLILVAVLGGATATNWWLGGLQNVWTPSMILLALILTVVVVLAALTDWRLERRDVRSLAMVGAAAGLAFMLLANFVESFALATISQKF